MKKQKCVAVHVVSLARTNRKHTVTKIIVAKVRELQMGHMSLVWVKRNSMLDYHWSDFVHRLDQGYCMVK